MIEAVPLLPQMGDVEPTSRMVEAGKAAISKYDSRYAHLAEGAIQAAFKAMYKVMDVRTPMPPPVIVDYGVIYNMGVDLYEVHSLPAGLQLTDVARFAERADAVLEMKRLNEIRHPEGARANG